MWHPPFQINGRGGTLRYTDKRGKRRVVSGRRHYLYGRTYVDALLTGWGTDFEMRVSHAGPWHPLRLTPAEAEQLLAANRLARGRLRTLQRRSDYTGPRVAA